MNRSRGFSLAELMVVVGILALLATILLPYLGGLTGQTRTLICLNNLHRVNQSVQTWASRAESWNQQAMAEGGWTAVVKNLTGGGDILKCPEGGPLFEGSPVESQIVIRTSPTSTVAIPLVGQMDGGNWKVLKLSSSQKTRLGEGRTVTPEPYMADDNPNVYWWCYDDGTIGDNSDHDYQDLVIRVTKKGDGTASVFIVAETGGHPEVWSPDLKICYAVDGDINVYHHSGVPGVTRTLPVGGASHYGMNVAKLDMRLHDKVQAMDYMSATAKSTDRWDREDWDKDGDGRPDFLRHQGKMNIVLLDGTAKTVRRQDVDPEDLEIERTLWQP